MHEKVSLLKSLLNLTPADEAEIARHHNLLSQQHQAFHANLHTWFQTSGLDLSNPQQLHQPLLTKDFFNALVAGNYDQSFYSILYRQSLHWYHMDLNENQTLIILSRIWQEFLNYTSSLNKPALQRSLCLVVDMIRIITVNIYRLHRELQALQQKTKYEMTRINQAFSLLAANLPDNLIQSYLDHQHWKYVAISLILGKKIKSTTSLVQQNNCNLTKWLHEGGYNIIPAEQKAAFDQAHQQVHQLAEQIIMQAKQQQPEYIFSLLDELEVASNLVSQTLLRCIDESITELANYDPLTKLRNRTTLEALFKRETALAKRFNKNLGVILLDIDHFKKINDEYGHLFGDQVLKELSQLLSQTIRVEDALFRWGGEEFLIIGLADTATENSLATIAERIRAQVEQKLWCQDSSTPIKFTVSAGVVEVNFSHHNPQMNQIFAQADKLLYQAKQAGRNQVVSAKI